MNKSTSYRETFRRHRRLLSLPVVIAVVVAAWFVLGAPKTYQSTASLWVDNPASTDSSLGNANPAVVPPAQQEQNVVAELLATQSFTLAVGHHSALGPYLASHGSTGFSPTALLGGGGSLEARIVGSFGPKQVITTVAGPQVLQISYRGPTPTVARSTLGALVGQLQQDSFEFNQRRNQGVIGYYRAQVQAASQALATARAQAGAYVGQHPNATAGDPNLSALQTAQGAASNQLTQATQRLNEATSAANDRGASGSTVQVIDQASAPTGPATSKKKQLLEILGGLFAGVLISFLAVVALTPGKADSWDADLPRGLPLESAAGSRNGVARPAKRRPAARSPAGRK